MSQTSSCKDCLISLSLEALEAWVAQVPSEQMNQDILLCELEEVEVVVVWVFPLVPFLV